ncbi:D-2-hydroxyacid dehydrogenase [Tardiphaga sp. 215_C5_N2_1]|uniref:D-2-hydroxyacid dehydrogenase n=1 Tax=Tardiphaga sp. 215_C5_N2_1 TaxID=3240774 RepID=UPI003F8AE131
MQRYSRLRLVQFLSAGYESAEFLGVPKGAAVCNASEIWSPVVAEHAVALMLGLIRRLPQLERRRIARLWDRGSLNASLSSLDGATIGILGYGAIGREIAQRLRPFGAGVIGFSRSAKPCAVASRVAPMSGLDRELPDLDMLVNVMPSSAATRHFINPDILSRLKLSAFFVNVGRGATVDETALIDYLRSNRIAGAALDVFETEPLPSDSPLWDLDNVILSPHAAGYGSTGIIHRAHELCRHNLAALRDGGAFRNEVRLKRSASE